MGRGLYRSTDEYTNSDVLWNEISRVATEWYTNNLS